MTVKREYNVGDIVEYNWTRGSTDNIYLILHIEYDKWGIPYYSCQSILTGMKVDYQFSIGVRVLA